MVVFSRICCRILVLHPSIEAGGIVRDRGFTESFIEESVRTLQAVRTEDVEAVVGLILKTRERRGRIFFCGSGGGAAHASHATCDFRKLARIEAYAPTDNVAELTARINDEGWDISYANWLLGSHINEKDCLFVFSVGGGDADLNVSPNLINAIKLAKQVGAGVTGVVGRDGGTLKRMADCCILIPSLNADNVTAQTEAMQAVFWHLIVTHPALIQSSPKWESLAQQKQGN